MSGFIQGVLVPGLPQPLLVPEQNAGWQKIRDSFEEVRDRIAALEPDLLLIYSVMWPSVIGHQIQAHPAPKWVHVDELFHDLGSMPYQFKIDSEFAHAFRDAAEARGLEARCVAYDGFPIDTGSVVALKLLNPDNAIPACIVSSNVYADRAETVVLGKAAADAVAAQGKRAVAVVVSTLSNRLFTEFIDPADDAIHSAKDDEWNRKMLEFLGAGRLEDMAQLSRQVHDQIRVKKVVSFKPMWWLSAAMGAHNHYDGDVLCYEPIYGTGGAVVTLTPTEGGVGDKEFDEDDVEAWKGDREVLSGTEEEAVATPVADPPEAAAEPADPTADGDTIRTRTAPDPVGAYPHARRVGDLLYLSGVGPRQAGTDAIPGGAIRDDAGAPTNYDIEAQTRAVIENVRAVLEAAGSSLEKVVDVTTFLVDMDRDFPGYNKVYAEFFTDIQATRTTLAITALPTPIAIEFKVIARP
jgi:reactive intermediate/imine deaminase